MKTLHAKDIAKQPRSQLWDLARQHPRSHQFKLVFDDGTIKTNYQQTLFSAYCWGIYQLYPKTPTSVNHHINNAPIRETSHTELMNRVLWDCHDAYRGRVDMEKLWEFIYQETNRLYNDFTYGCEEYVQSITVMDFTQIAGDPEILEIVGTTPPTGHAIASYCYPKARHLLTDVTRFPNNPITRSVATGLLSEGQALQCLVARGAATDVDSSIFPKPIMNNFTVGMNTLYDSLVESRSASKSLTFNEKHLREAEYFNRRLQLMSSAIMRLHRGDCGSKHYLPWTVHARDLPKIAGIYYKSGKGLAVIQESDQHLVGQTIEMRSPFYCAHSDSQGVCATCLGEISHAIPDGTNPGDFMARCLSEEVAQTILSTKHLNSNATAASFHLTEVEARFIKLTDDNSLLLAPGLRGKDVKLVISPKEAKGFGVFEMSSATRVELLQVSQITELTVVSFILKEGKYTSNHLVNVSSGSLYSSLSHEMLQYIRDHGWELDEYGNFQIDLKEWDFNLPAMVIPLRSRNMLDAIQPIEQFLKAGRDDPNTLAKNKNLYNSVTNMTDIPLAIKQFYELVTGTLNVNLPHLSLILKSTMIRSSEHHDYRLPHLGNRVEFGSFSHNMARRSAAIAMAFERHHQLLTSPTNYLIRNKPDSIYDALLR